MDTLAIAGKAYRPRVVDASLAHALQSAGAVVIEGPRACGKTMSALNAAQSYAFLDDPVTMQLRDIAPASLLEGETPRLLDEWQLAPELWNLVRRAVDRTSEPGQFILTGSALPADDVTRHTGAGRFLRLRQRTMSWRERDSSDGNVSLQSLFEGERPSTRRGGMPYHRVIAELSASGFPALTDLEESRQAALLRAYLDEVGRLDLRRLASVNHDPVVIARLIRALARSTASEVSYRTLAADTAAAAPSIKAETIANYVDLLERLFVVERQRAWTPTLRSRARLRTSDKVHLADPALAVAALAANSRQLASDPNTVGLLFESAVFHDLSVYSAALGGSVQHYRDSNGHEIDMVVTLPDGRWAAVEVKLGGNQLTAGASSLANALAQIDERAVGQPAFRLVVTGTGDTLALDDGTLTCSLAQLGP